MMVMAVTGSASRIARNTFTDSALRRSSILRSNSSYLNGIARKGCPYISAVESSLTEYKRVCGHLTRVLVK